MVSLETVTSIDPLWASLLPFGWLIYQLYWPLHRTKLQQFHVDLTQRLKRIEVIQLALSEEMEGMDEDQVKRVHDMESLSTDDLKR